MKLGTTGLSVVDLSTLKERKKGKQKKKKFIDENNRPCKRHLVDHAVFHSFLWGEVLGATGVGHHRFHIFPTGLGNQRTGHSPVREHL